MSSFEALPGEDYWRMQTAFPLETVRLFNGMRDLDAASYTEGVRRILSAYAIYHSYTETGSIFVATDNNRLEILASKPLDSYSGDPAGATRATLNVTRKHKEFLEPFADPDDRYDLLGLGGRPVRCVAK